MSEKMQKAIDLLDKGGEKYGTYGKLVAQHLIELITDDESAQKVIDEKKSFEECFNSINSKARKQAVRNCAVIEDAQVYAWAREYYGLTERETEPPRLEIVKKPADDLDIDLFDLL